jgi:hypothetical protein
MNRLIRSGSVAVADIAVTEVNSHDNRTIADVIGNKNDTSVRILQKPSLMNFAKGGYYHVHAPAKVYPNLGDAISLTRGATAAWGSGSPVILIPAGAMEKPFDIHWIKISRISHNDEYQIDLYGGGNLIGSIAFEREAPQTRQYDAPIQIPVQSAGKEITAVLSAKGTAARECFVKVYYHDYPDVD